MSSFLLGKEVVQDDGVMEKRDLQVVCGKK
jgi:hypothetical protein